MCYSAIRRSGSIDRIHSTWFRAKGVSPENERVNGLIRSCRCTAEFVGLGWRKSSLGQAQIGPEIIPTDSYAAALFVRLCILGNVVAAFCEKGWLLRAKVNTVPGEWTPFHGEVDAVPTKMDSKAERRNNVRRIMESRTFYVVITTLCGWPFSSYQNQMELREGGWRNSENNDETKRATLSYKGIVK